MRYLARRSDARTLSQVDYARSPSAVAGEVASVDGLRFIVPVPSIHTGRNPKYFGLAGRGVTYLSYVSDQFSGFHAFVVPGTLGDSISSSTASSSSRRCSTPRR